MKALILACALLSTPFAKTEIAESDASHFVAQHEEQKVDCAGASGGGYEDQLAFDVEDDDDDSFDALMNSHIPDEKIADPRPISTLEAYLRRMGISVLMKCIAVKIWLENQWRRA